MYTIATKTFSGPFDLLLQLITGQKLAITDISLSQIADQFLTYCGGLEEQRAEELADFLVVASELLYIKSRALLPLPPEIEEPSQLKEQLALYQTFWERASFINEQWMQKPLLSRPFIRIKRAASTEMPKSLTSQLLLNAYEGALKRLGLFVVRLPKEQIERRVSVEERIAHLRDLFTKRSRLVFSHFMTSKDRSHVIASFLALLELIKQRECAATQASLFSEISLERT
ncbi:MAG: segregation/condensation protein A [bacterium]|nr:segregation/condensation protein A [bacterium]